jgi:hypothetical protein
LTRNYVNRKTKEHSKRLARSKDFSTYVTERGPKIQELDEDVMAKKRMIYLKDIYVDPKSISETINEKISELCRVARDTDQYIKLVNHYIDLKTLQIYDIGKIQKSFDNQIDFFISEKDPIKKIKKN